MPINPEMLKQLLDEFVEKEAVTREEINVVQQQIEELEHRVLESKERLKLVGVDKEKINAMMDRYAGGDWGAVPEAEMPAPAPKAAAARKEEAKKEEPKAEPPAPQPEPASTSSRRNAMASLIKPREPAPVSEPEPPPPVVSAPVVTPSATIKPLATTAAASFAQAAAEADKASTANIPILDPVLTQPPPDIVSDNNLAVAENSPFSTPIGSVNNQPVVENSPFSTPIGSVNNQPVVENSPFSTPIGSGQFPGIASEPTGSGHFQSINPATSGQFQSINPATSGQFQSINPTTSGQFPPVNPGTISGQFPAVSASQPHNAFPDVEDVPADEFQTSDGMQAEAAPSNNPFLRSSFTVSRPTMQEMEQPRSVEQQQAPAVFQDVHSSPFTQPVQQPQVPQQQDPAPAQASSGPNISFDSMFETEDSQAEGTEEEKADNDDTVKSINDALRGLFR